MLKTMLMQLSLINFNQDGKTVYRIVDEEQTLVAKVNGSHNLNICKNMVQAFNDREHVDKMKSLLRFRLIDIFRGLAGSSPWITQIQTMLRDESNQFDFDNLLAELKQQTTDCPEIMVRVLGGEAVQILQLL